MGRDSVIRRARELRKNQTLSEAKLWSELRNRKFRGLKFLRQYPITCEIDGIKHFFIADFYCAEKRLVIELDGKIHDYQKDRDTERDLMIKSLALEILHIKNEELEDMERVKLKIDSEP